jgi:arylsulfatase
MRYCFDAEDEPTRRRVQHYEMSGNRAIWADGWKALAMHRKGQRYEDDVWELYHTDVDFSEVNNLAEAEPERLAALKQQWLEAAEANNVLPLDDRGYELWVLKRPGAASARSHFRYVPGIAHIDRFNTPDTRNRSFAISAQVETADGADLADGVVVAVGAGTGGHVLYLDDGHLVFELTRGVGDPSIVRSDHNIPPNTRELGVRYSKQAEHQGVAVLLADREPVGQGPIETLPFRQAMYGMDIGKDTGPTVSSAYTGPFPFTGTIFSVEYALDDDRDDLREAAAAEFDAAMSEQ